MAKKTGNYSEDELLEMLVSTMGNPMDFDYEEEDLIRIMEEISKIDGANELFRAIMGRDMRLHFLAQSDLKRENIKGHYAAFAWMRGIMSNLEKHKELLTRKSKREA